MHGPDTPGPFQGKQAKAWGDGTFCAVGMRPTTAVFRLFLPRLRLRFDSTLKGLLFWF